MPLFSFSRAIRKIGYSSSHTGLISYIIHREMTSGRFTMPRKALLSLLMLLAATSKAAEVEDELDLVERGDQFTDVEVTSVTVGGGTVVENGGTKTNVVTIQLPTKYHTVYLPTVTHVITNGDTTRIVTKAPVYKTVVHRVEASEKPRVITIRRHHHHHQGTIPSPGPMGIIPGSVVYTPETVANAMSFVPNYTIPNVHIVERPFTAQPMAIVQQEIYIDENYVGNIIGREGRHINSIKRTTGCSIYIDPPVEGSRERKLTIKGTAMGSQAAIMLISNKIELDRANSNGRHRGIYQSSGPVDSGVGQ